MTASQLLKTVRIATYTLPESMKLMLQVSTHDQNMGRIQGAIVKLSCTPVTSPCVCSTVLNLKIDTPLLLGLLCNHRTN